VLNTNCGSSQFGRLRGRFAPKKTWLKEDFLRRTPNVCTARYGHPRSLQQRLFPKHAEHPRTSRLLAGSLRRPRRNCPRRTRTFLRTFRPAKSEGIQTPITAFANSSSGTGRSQPHPTRLRQTKQRSPRRQTYGVLKLTLYPANTAGSSYPSPARRSRFRRRGLPHFNFSTQQINPQTQLVRSYF